MKRLAHFVIGTLTLAGLALNVCAQDVTRSEDGGRAEVAAQGYYLRNGNAATVGTTGMVVNFEEFLPSIGLIRGNLEAYRSGGSIQPANNYLQVRGMIWQGLRWNVSGGDFRTSGTLLRNPFNNLFFPDIQARGVQVEAGDSNQGFSFFYGRETLLAGPRIPFRIEIPQNVMGGSIRRTIGNFQAGVRFTRFENLDRDSTQDLLFPLGRDFQNADNLTFYNGYRLNDHFQLYGEVTGSRAQVADSTPEAPSVSYFFGPSWESERLTVRANYANLSRSYLPIPGYFVGDRKGPYGEIRYRFTRKIEAFGSVSDYRTIDSYSDVLPVFKSRSITEGVSLELPFRIYANAQYSSMEFASRDPNSGADQNSTNHLWTGTLNRRVGNHTLRFTGREMQLGFNGLLSHQRALEFEDLFQFRRFILGGGVRNQTSEDRERRSAMYFRGSAQMNLGRFSFFGFYEGGKDLANQTVFATNATNSTVLNASYRVTKDWTIQAEAFRNRVVSQINAENLFVQANQNLLANPLLNQFNQWSLLFRVARSFTWGSPVPGGNFDLFTTQRLPIVGNVEGFVELITAEGRQPAPGVPLTLENGKSTMTGPDGRYRFETVAEGPHTVSIDMEQLPADFNPGRSTKSPVLIAPRKMARVDFEVYSLAGFFGTVKVLPGSEFESLEGIVVRLEPAGQFTTTDRDGNFAFFNLPEGNYTAVLDAATIPEGAELRCEPNVSISVRNGNIQNPLEYQIRRKPVEDKPVRKVFENVIGAVSPTPNSPQHSPR